MLILRPAPRAERMSGTVTLREDTPGDPGATPVGSIGPPSPRRPRPVEGTDCTADARGRGLRPGQSRSLRGSERDVVLHPALHRLDLPEQLLLVLPALHEVDIGRV